MTLAEAEVLALSTLKQVMEEKVRTPAVSNGNVSFVVHGVRSLTSLSMILTSLSMIYLTTCSSGSSSTLCRGFRHGSNHNFLCMLKGFRCDNDSLRCAHTLEFSIHRNPAY